MRIADDPFDTGKRREFFGRALGVAAGDDDSHGGILAVNRADGAPRLRVRSRSDGARVHDDNVGVRFGGTIEAARAQLALDRGGIGLRRTTSELLDEKSGHSFG